MLRTCIIVSEFVFMVLALYKAAKFAREATQVTGLNLARILIRDQACYFIAYVRVSSRYPTLPNEL